LGADFTAAKVCFLSHIFNTFMWGPWEANSHPTGQEMPHHSWNLKFYYCLHRSRTLSLASWVSPRTHTLRLPSTLRSLSWSLPFGVLKLKCWMIF
jgi:hypothetical protein